MNPKGQREDTIDRTTPGERATWPQSILATPAANRALSLGRLFSARVRFLQSHQTSIDIVTLNFLLFARGRPTYVAFDLLMTDGVDLRPLPFRHHKAPKARLRGSVKGPRAGLRSPTLTARTRCSSSSAVPTTGASTSR